MKTLKIINIYNSYLIMYFSIDIKSYLKVVWSTKWELFVVFLFHFAFVL